MEDKTCQVERAEAAIALLSKDGAGVEDEVSFLKEVGYIIIGDVKNKDVVLPYANCIELREKVQFIIANSDDLDKLGELDGDTAYVSKTLGGNEDDEYVTFARVLDAHLTTMIARGENFEYTRD